VLDLLKPGDWRFNQTELITTVPIQVTGLCLSVAAALPRIIQPNSMQMMRLQSTVWTALLMAVKASTSLPDNA
jgi:hypothetical protein